MYPSHLSNYIIKESQSLAEGYWKLEKQRHFMPSTMLVVLDKEYRYAGVMTKSDFNKCMDLEDGEVGQYSNKRGKVCAYCSESRNQALLIFADNPHINAIPVIDNSGYLKDIIFRQQVFYLDFFIKNLLPRMHYAKQIHSAANLAKALGYSAISVIEFGVAGGRGLTCCEFHAREISRLFNIEIEVYGFDSNCGLPHSQHYQDRLFRWNPGFYPMNIELLQKRLQFAKLVIGDIKETSKSFMEKHCFAPIGAMLVDVDYYTSTVPILNMLTCDIEKFLPRVYMYFDDIGGYSEFLGELLAIEEFNQHNEDVKISRAQLQDSRLFCAHLFKHEKYNIHAESVPKSLNLI